MGIFDRLKRAWTAAGEDNVSILAAGVAYYAFLAFVPLLAAIVLSYGLIADPQMVANHIAALAAQLPEAAAELIGEQLESMVETSGAAKGLGLLVAIVLALVGARNGAGALITAIALAFNDTRKRGFVKANTLALGVTLGAILALGLVLVALSVTAALSGMVPGFSGTGAVIGQVASFAILAVAGACGAAWLYRHVPLQTSASFSTVFPGALLASLGLVALTAAFGYYVANFGNYNATYGSLGAVVVLLTWLYLSAYVLLLGAEIAAAGVETPSQERVASN